MASQALNMATKMGVVELNGHAANYHALDGAVSWSYDYKFQPSDVHVEWLNENNIEYMPMIMHKHEWIDHV